MKPGPIVVEGVLYVPVYTGLPGRDDTISDPFPFLDETNL